MTILPEIMHRMFFNRRSHEVKIMNHEGVEKACVKCTHCRMYSLGRYVCIAEPKGVDKVTGDVLGESCDRMRSEYGKCGPYAKLFKRRPSPPPLPTVPVS